MFVRANILKTWRYASLGLMLLLGIALLGGDAFAGRLSDGSPPAKATPNPRPGDSGALTNCPTGCPNDAYLELVPGASGNCPAPPNGGSTQVGCRFVLDLMLNAGSHVAPDGATAQQSYLTFTYQYIQVARVERIVTDCMTTNTARADLSVFDAALQNEVCNGPGPCNFRGGLVDPGSVAYASGALANCPNGCPDPNQPPPENANPFRVAQVGICAIAPGQAVLHWQFSPPAPPERDTEAFALDGDAIQDHTRFHDYIINVVPPPSTPTPGPNDVYLEFVPGAAGNCPAPPNGGSTQVGCRFVLDLMVNAGSNEVTAQQSYLTFTYQLIQNARVDQIGTTCVPTNTMTADLTTFDATLQNEICNGPAACVFRGTPVDPGSIAYASGALSNPPSQGTFRVASNGLCAMAPGQAILHWQFLPPYRNTEIVCFACYTNPDLFRDYIINVMPGPPPPTATGTPPTNTPTSTRTTTRTPTPVYTPTPGCLDYLISVGSGTPIPGGTLVPSSRCDDCTVNIPLPFTFRLYGAPFASVNASSNGNLQFASNNSTYGNTCLPQPTMNNAILPHWDDLRTDINAGDGVFTSVTGTAPNRQFSIEWHASYYSGSGSANFEVRLYENQDTFDVLYGTIDQGGDSATVGVQRSTGGQYSLFECNMGSLSSGMRLTFTPFTACITNTPTITGTPTNTFTPTNTYIPTYTRVPTNTGTPNTPTSTPLVTPVYCPPGFQDVPPGDPYYPYIHCVTCQTSMDAYACGGPNEPCVPPNNYPYFRPNNPYIGTNADVYKLIVAAERWPIDTTGGPHFTDVPPCYPYYIYIETAYNRGLIPGPPGGPFYPDSTHWQRNQFARLLYRALTQYATVTPTATTTVCNVAFSDVPPSDPYYEDIMYLACNGIMLGYPDGTFRPYNHITEMTRAEMAEVIARAYPNCSQAPTPVISPTCIVTPLPTLTYTPTPTCSPSGAWSIVPSPNGGTGNNLLNAVSAISSNDVWAVGWYGDAAGFHTLTEHWNGSTWSIVPSPGDGGLLYGVAAVSSNDVWAVGDYNGGGALTLHWDGSAWSIVPSPSTGYSLNGVTAISSNDVWAVGTDRTGSVAHTLTMHWNGTQWSVVPSPNQGLSLNRLLAVSAVSANDMWAVGYYWVFATAERILTEHWDGSTWSIVPNPNTQLRLEGVAAVASNDVWAVGSAGILHWNGSAWSVVGYSGHGLDGFRGVTAISSNDVWAVGLYGSGSSLPETVHWNGSTWSAVPIPDRGGRYTVLQGAEAISSNDVWAVGWDTSSDGSSDYTLTEHYTSVPCATATITPLTGTPTPTPTCISGDYTYTTATATIIPGTTDTGNHCDDCTTNIVLPFPFRLYDQTFTTANISSNGNLQFASSNSSVTSCPLAGSAMSYAMLAAFEDLRTDTTGSCSPGPCGVYTSVSGSAPNRVLNIEWRAYPFAGSGNANFEIRLYENPPGPGQPFEFVYGRMDLAGAAGVVKDASNYTCFPGNVSQGLKIAWTLSQCNTPTPTLTPGLMGHVTWDGRDPQPDPSQILPITLTLRPKDGSSYIDYPSQDTDENGRFTVSVAGLPNGEYYWRAKGPRFLANSGTLTLTGAPLTYVEMGLMRVGDANNDNFINVSDFNILKVSFGWECGYPSYDDRADFTDDCIVNVQDFNLMKRNFGMEGAPQIRP